MKFGVGGRYLSSVVQSVDEIVTTVCLAEKLGFSSAWISDDEFFRDPYPVITACALATKKITLSTGMTNPFTRHPSVTARAMATLQEISAGRMRLGLATGGGNRLLKPLQFEKREGLSRCREYASVVRSLLSGEEVTFHGKFLHLNHVKLAGMKPMPVEIFLAGQSGNVMRTAGEIADGVVVSYAGANYLDYSLKKIEQGAASSNRRLSDLRLVGWVPLGIATDLVEPSEIAKFYAANFLSNLPKEVLEKTSIDLNIAHEIRSGFSDPTTRQKAINLVTNEIISTFTAVGDRAKCSEVLAEYSSRGFSEVVFWLPYPNFPDKIESLARISKMMQEYR